MSEPPVPQRWVRPDVMSAPPGHWKKQLPTKHLKVAATGNVHALKTLLAQHPEFLNRRANHNRTLLWEATRAGKLPAVKLLVAAGADVNATGCYNSETFVQITPLCAAVYYKRREVDAFLRPRVNPPDVFRSAFLGDAMRVNRLLDEEPDLLDAEDPFDNVYYTPLVAFAIAGGHADLTDAIVRRGANIGPYSSQLIQGAARLDRVDLLKLLFDAGADIRTVGATAFVVASEPATLKCLLDHGLSPQTQAEGGFPPIVYVARGDKGERPDKVAVLLEHGADPNSPGPDRRTALHYAANAGHVRVVELLVGHGARIDAKDDLGCTPLDLANAGRKATVVELLKSRQVPQRGRGSSPRLRTRRGKAG
jgi:ankyrin repeat protein